GFERHATDFRNPRSELFQERGPRLFVRLLDLARGILEDRRGRVQKLLPPVADAFAEAAPDENGWLLRLLALPARRVANLLDLGLPRLVEAVDDEERVEVPLRARQLGVVLQPIGELNGMILDRLGVAVPLLDAVAEQLGNRGLGRLEDEDLDAAGQLFDV